MSAQPKPGTFPYQVAQLNAKQVGQAVKSQNLIIQSAVECHIDRVIFWQEAAKFWALSAEHWNLVKNLSEEAKSLQLRQQAVEMVEQARKGFVEYVQQEVSAAYDEGYRDSGNMPQP